MNEYKRQLQQITRESCRKEISTTTPDPESDTSAHSPTAMATTSSQNPGPLPFATLDVFTSTPFTGNQLAVVQLPAGICISKETKQSVAREFNFSETVFLIGSSSSSHNVQKIEIFTTHQELPFAGHPVIGAACYTCEYMELNIEHLSFLCKAGDLTVNYDRAAKIAEVSVPHNVRIHQRRGSSRDVLKSQLPLAGIPSSTPNLPVVSIVKGMSFVLIELPSRSLLEKLDAGPLGVDTSSVQLDEGWTPSFVGCYFYFATRLPESNALRIRTRMLEVSVGEDAATGSAACTLAVYLALKDGVPNQQHRFIFEQGVEMGRPSEITVVVKLDSQGMGVEYILLAGKAVLVTQGTLCLPDDS